MNHEIEFARLSDVDAADILQHMSNPRLKEHMPLMPSNWDAAKIAGFIEAKEACWKQDGLGHWAFIVDGEYVGWGGFQKEGDEWDYGLVLKPECFGLGLVISRLAIDFAVADSRIPYVTFLLPPTRTKLGALKRLGAEFVERVDYDGEAFLKYRLETA